MVCVQFFAWKKNTIKTKNEAKVGQKERLNFLLEVLRKTQIMHFESTVPICELTCSYRFSENLILTPPIPKQNFLLSSFVDTFIFIPFIYSQSFYSHFGFGLLSPSVYAGTAW